MGRDRGNKASWSPDENFIVAETYEQCKEGRRKAEICEIIKNRLAQAGYYRTDKAVSMRVDIIRNANRYSANIKNATKKTVFPNLSKDRKWGQEDIDLVHWYRQLGYSPARIASEIHRRPKDVEAMLKLPPTEPVREPMTYYKSPTMERWI